MHKNRAPRGRGGRGGGGPAANSGGRNPHFRPQGRTQGGRYPEMAPYEDPSFNNHSWAPRQADMNMGNFRNSRNSRPGMDDRNSLRGRRASPDHHRSKTPEPHFHSRNDHRTPHVRRRSRSIGEGLNLMGGEETAHMPIFVKHLPSECGKEGVAASESPKSERSGSSGNVSKIDPRTAFDIAMNVIKESGWGRSQSLLGNLTVDEKELRFSEIKEKKLYFGIKNIVPVTRLKCLPCHQTFQDKKEVKLHIATLDHYINVVTSRSQNPENMKKSVPVVINIPSLININNNHDKSTNGVEFQEPTHQANAEKLNNVKEVTDSALINNQCSNDDLLNNAVSDSSWKRQSSFNFQDDEDLDFDP